MKVISETTDFCIQEETAVAIGKFDGVHIGHRRLIEEILKEQQKGRKACIFTFDISPSALFGNPDEKLLTLREEKRRIFESLGIDILIEYPLTKTTAAIPPELFIEEILAKKLNTKLVAAGEDLSFGAGGKGNAELLRKMAPLYGMEVAIIKKIKLDDEEVSSTYVRETVEKGDMILAETLLEEPYFVTGTVVHGRALARSLGMPTLNIIPDKKKLLPPCGVYYAGVRLRNRYYQAICNVGYKPTVEQADPVLMVESHLYDFSDNAYGEELEVFLYAFKRREEKFESVEALKEQMEEDIAAGRLYER